MVRRRNQTRMTSNWVHAVVFNALLLLIPVLGAQTITGAFSQSGLGDAPTIEALDTTRQNMDDAFEAMIPRGADQKAFWNDLVERELVEKDLSAARGYLLAAPIMLDRETVKAIEAAAKSERRGSEDERLARAAIRFLSDDAQARYESATMPMGRAESYEEDIAETPDAEATPAGELYAQDIAGTEASVTASLGVLGSYKDLADNSKRWISGDRVDTVILKLTALALRSADSESRASVATIEAASILKSARRARRLTKEFENLLEEHTQQVFPDDALKAALGEALAGLAKASVRAKRVKTAYEATLVQDGMAVMQSDLDQISRIGTLTSKAGAVTLLEYVETGTDLRKARLLTEAGGDRAIALTKQSGARALRYADAGIVWNNQITLKVMGLTAAAMALFWAMFATFLQVRPRRAHKPEVFLGPGY